MKPTGVGMRVGPGGPEITLTYDPRPSQGTPSRLACTVSATAMVDVPFTVKNVPLP
jgi:hypothetical protein